MKEYIVTTEKGANQQFHELIRSKYCKHHKDEEPGMVYCPKIVGGWVEEECYCSWAERKDHESGE